MSQYPTNSPYSESIADDPVFNPAVHLALGQPDRSLSLTDLGYTAQPVGVPTSVAATSCFQILSDEGVAAMYHVCKQLEPFATSNPRIARNVRGGVYRSNFLRDFSASIDVTNHLSELMQTELAPHGMPHQQAHLNFQPFTPSENVDKWHWDTLQVDYVMFVTNPNEVEGGEFQYFNGTRDEMVALRERGESVPTDRISVPEIPGAGYAVLMQGDQVVHQARGIEAGERITLVNGYTYLDSAAKDFCAIGQLVHADPEATVVAEYARHMAIRCESRLHNCIVEPDFNGDAQSQATLLRQARIELDHAIEQLESLTKEELQHFGD